MALMQTPPVDLGALCPEFQLPATNGAIFNSQDLIRSGQPFLVAVICNHCPYVKAIETRLIALAHVFNSLGLGFVAMSSNDAETYPEDSFEKMKLKNYPFIYVYDESQEIAKKLGAVCTPDFFLYDHEAKLQYRGRLDDNWKDANLVTRQELLEAAIQLKLYKKLSPQTSQMPSMGCSLKWKK
jgi:thiol-disulfide isomerase/thioredoxin